MHICLVGIEYPYDTAFGGIATYQYLLANQLNKLGHKITVICGTNKDDYDYYENGIHVIRLHTDRINENVDSFCKYRLSIAQIINNINESDPIDIIESPEFSGELIEFLKNHNIPVVTKLHTSYTIWSKINNVKLPNKLHNTILKIENLVLKYSDKVICCSQLLKELMPKYHLWNNFDSIEVVGNPADVKNFYPLKNNHNSKIILFCGSVEKRKGVYVLAKAIPLVLKKLKDKDIKFQIIGNYNSVEYNGNSSKDQFLSYIPKEYHQNIEFLGQIENKELNSYYNQARIGIVPSLFDNLPYVAMEELLTELPLIASSNTGVKEMIEHGKSGYLYDSQNYRKLADTIIHVFKNPVEARRIGKNGRKAILKKYSPEVIAKRNLQIYQSVIENFKNKNNYKMHVCLTNFEYPPDTILGGISIYQKRIADALVKIGCKVTVICGTFNKYQSYNQDGINIIRIHKNFPYKSLYDYYSYRKRLVDEIEELNIFYKIDVIESPELSAELITFLKKQTVPVVTKLHTSYTIIKHFNNETSMFPFAVEKEIYKNENLILKYSDKVICCSQLLKELMPKYHLWDNFDSIEVVGNPADVKNFYPLKNNHSSKIILFCGKVIERKGVYVLAKAIPLVLKKLKDKDIKFQIIGDYNSVEYNGNSSKDQFLSYIPKEYHQNIEFLGQIENKELNSYYNQARIGIVPSLFDNLPYVAMEELLTELPLIASSNTGVKEMIEHGKSGYLYDSQNYRKLADTIIHVFKNPVEARRIGKNGRKAILKKYSPEVIAKRNLQIYQSAIFDFNIKNIKKRVCTNYGLKNISKFKYGGANYVRKCTYNGNKVVLKIYNNIKNYNFDLIKVLSNLQINNAKIIKFEELDEYKIVLYSYIEGKVKKKFSDKMLFDLFRNLRIIYTVKSDCNYKEIETIFYKLRHYYSFLKNIDNEYIKNIIEIYNNLNIYCEDEMVLVHGDLSFNNIIWNKGVPYLIDYDEAMYAPFEYEAASFLIKNCFYDSFFDIAYAKRIVKFYKINNFNIDKIKHYYYIFILKVLLEKYYYAVIYNLDLNSDSQKQDFWYWWYILLHNNYITEILFNNHDEKFLSEKYIKDDYKSTVLNIDNKIIVKYEKNSNLKFAENEQLILSNLNGYVNIPNLFYYKKIYKGTILKKYNFINNNNDKIDDYTIISEVYSMSNRLEKISKYIDCKCESIENKLILYDQSYNWSYIKWLIKKMKDDEEFHEKNKREPLIIVHDDLNINNILFDKSVYFIDFEGVKKYPRVLQIASFLTLYYLCESKKIPWNIVKNIYKNIEISYVKKVILFRLIKLYVYFNQNDITEYEKQKKRIVIKKIKEYGKIYE